MTDPVRRYKVERDAAVAHLRDMLASYDAPNVWELDPRGARFSSIKSTQRSPRHHSGAPSAVRAMPRPEHLQLSSTRQPAPLALVRNKNSTSLVS
jgi:hypothetical protein